MPLHYVTGVSMYVLTRERWRGGIVDGVPWTSWMILAGRIWWWQSSRASHNLLQDTHTWIPLRRAHGTCHRYDKRLPHTCHRAGQTHNARLRRQTEKTRNLKHIKYTHAHIDTYSIKFDWSLGADLWNKMLIF